MEITTTQSKVYLKDLFQGFPVSLEAKDGDVYYVPNPKSTDVVRTSEATTTTTGLVGFEYTVADGSIFRVNETLLVFSSAGVYKGPVVVIATGTLSLTVEDRNATALTLASGDKLYFKEDNVVTDGNVVLVDTTRYTTAIFKASDTCSLYIEKEDLKQAPLKKKE